MQTTQVALLECLDEICAAHGLTYFLSHGTLLGAIRHHGYIPGDLDIDILMPRADLERLCELREALPEHVFLQTPRTDPHFYNWGACRLRDSQTSAFEVGHVHRDTHHGIFIDIIVLDAWPADAHDAKTHHETLSSLHRQVFLDRYGARAPALFSGTAQQWQSAAEALRDSSSEQALAEIDRMNSVCHHANTGAVAYVRFGAELHRAWPSSWFRGARTEVFEGREFTVPAAAELVLEDLYGPDYLTPTLSPAPSGVWFDARHDFTTRLSAVRSPLADLHERSVVAVGTGAAWQLLRLRHPDLRISRLFAWGTEPGGESLGHRVEPLGELERLPRDDVVVLICADELDEAREHVQHWGFDDVRPTPWGLDPLGLLQHDPATPATTGALVTDPDPTADLTTPEHAYDHGYVNGVFDLLHVGHLNLLERARARSRRLTVGVLSDELVIYFKGRAPVIRYEDRARLLAALSVVDDVIKVDNQTIDKVAAHDALGFDCLFSGNDYVDNPYWLADRERLRARGSDIVFFDYTPSVSTTALREHIADSSAPADAANPATAPVSDPGAPVVLLDADGVLQWGPPRWEEDLDEIGGPGFGLECFSADQGPMIGQGDLFEVLYDVARRRGVHHRIGEIIALWCDIEPEPEVWQLVRELRSQGIRVFVATNQPRLRATVMRTALDYDTEFDGFLASCDLGAAKPSPGFFAAVARRVCVPTDRMVFLDDTAENVEAALLAGLRATLIDQRPAAPQVRRALAASGFTLS